MAAFYEKHKQAIDKVAFACGLLLTVYFFMIYFFPLMAPFVVGLLMALAMEPLMGLLAHKFKFGRTAASVICLLVLIVLIGGIGVLLVGKITMEARSFIRGFPAYLEDEAGLYARARRWGESMLALLPAGIRELVPTTGANVISIFSSALGNGVKSGSWNVVTNIPGVIVGFFLSFISAFFFMKDRAKIFGWLRDKTPKWLRERVSFVKKGMAYAILGYFKAQLIMMSIVSCIVIVGLAILQYPYAMFMGLLIAVVDAIPVFGSGAILWPWAVISFLNGKYFTGAALLMIYGVVFITRQTVEPRVLGSQIGIHPLVTLMSMYAGIKLLGVFGIIMGPAVVLTIKAIFEAKRHTSQQEPPKGLAESA
ncbi:MAG: sporulation integral membrane protein YtvI [Clostridiales bacterium]|jgi:sporulation integral membrane protein YtvI|nr:sporulation integral membrane protein YtvI [Clostridiales bacterium]MDR2751117.1 sporulation integral membrane protein YtvI [Clostridiales bacterium]